MAKDNNIEKYFKKKLESKEFPYQEADWQSLEKQLDEAGLSVSRQGFVNRTSKLAALLLIALTTTFLLGWFARDFFREDVVSNKEPEQNAQSGSSNKTGINDEPGYDNIPGTIQKDTSDEAFNDDVAQKKPAVKKKGKHEGNKTVYPNPDLQEQSTAYDSQAKGMQEEYTEGSRQYSPGVNRENPITNHLPIREMERLAWLGWHDTIVSKGSPLSAENLVLLNNNADNKTQHSEEGIQYSTRVQRSGHNWALGFSMASDFNSVGFPFEKTVTLRIGGQLFYSPTPKWILSVGALYSNKKYNSRGEFYNPPTGYWIKHTNGVVPDQVTGSCRVIDIPILATYRLLQQKNRAFTVSAGMSNYYMLDQYYNYEFNQDIPEAKKGWSTRNNAWVPLGVANFALGMEILVASRTMLTVEPFLKLPVKNIGWANLELYSMGMNLGLRYQLY